MIKLENISYKDILKNISLEIEQGDYVAVVGKNGSGKSTLAKIIKGLIPVEGYKPSESIGLLFQNPENQMISSFVDEEIAFALENLQVPREEMEAKIDQALELVQIKELKTRATYNLSGGQKQKVAIAALIATELDVLILDESTSMIDPYSAGQILDLLDKLNKKGKTIIHITHNANEAKRAKRTIEIKGGELNEH